MTKKGTAARFVIVMLFLATLIGGAGHPYRAGATGPCDGAGADPNPPIGEPEPLIGGTVVDAGTNDGVSGATVRLYRCDSGAATQADSTTTNGLGRFSFSDLTEEKWHYVSVDLSGPLSGMVPASATSNPTDLIGVGEGDSGLLLEFE